MRSWVRNENGELTLNLTLTLPLTLTLTLTLNGLSRTILIAVGYGYVLRNSYVTSRGAGVRTGIGTFRVWVWVSGKDRVSWV